jgi:hypothetical protein
MTNSKQMAQTRDEKGRITGGTPPAGFNVNPQNRHNGAWKKEDTPRFKLEQMMKLPEPDLRKIAEDKAAPLFERKLATAIAKGQWREIKEMIQEVYGKPKESVDVTTGGDKLNVALVRFEDGGNK